MTTLTIEELQDDLELAQSQIPDTMEKARKHYDDFLEELVDEIDGGAMCDNDADTIEKAKKALGAELEQLQQLITHYQAWL